MEFARSHKLSILAVLLLVGAMAGSATAVWTGPMSGTQDYNNTANWNGGVIDDVIQGSFTFNVNYRLTADHTTAGDLTIEDNSGGSDWHLRGATGNETLFLNGNFFYDRNGHGGMTVGSTNSAQDLTLNLMGGLRQFNHIAPPGGDTLNIHATVTNGGIQINNHSGTVAFSSSSNPNYTGATNVLSGTLRFDAAPASLTYDVANSAVLQFNNVSAASGANITVRNSATMTLSGANGALPSSATLNLLNSGVLQLGDGGANHASNDRLADSYFVPLSGGGTVRLQGTNAGVTTETIGVAADGMGRLVANHGTGAASAFLTVNLDRTNRGVLHVSGTDLGSGSAPNSQINFTAAPTTIGGGGGAGTVNISVVPYLFGGAAATPTLATYGATGVRLLDTTTEFVTYNTVSGLDANPAAITTAPNDANVRVTFNSNGGFSLSSNKTVNSLTFQGLGGNILSGAAVVSVTSGAVVAAAHNNPFQINFAGLSFGSTEGLITLANDAGTNGHLAISSIISGTNGVTFSGTKGVQAGNPNFNKIRLSGNNTYTGQTTINNVRLETTAAERINNLSVVQINKNAELRLGGNETLAGLTGGGELVLQSNTALLGQAAGDLSFAGLISGAGSVSKFGANTQALTGNNTYTGSTIVSGGALLVHGATVGQGSYNAMSGGRLGGNGTIGLATGQAINVASGGTLAPGASIGTLTVNGDVSLSGTLEIEIDGSTGLTDLLVINGDLTLTGSSLIDINVLAPLDPKGTYVLAEFESVTGTFGGFMDFPGTHLLYLLDNQLVLAPIPEPSSLLLGLGMLFPLYRRRRRQARMVAAA